MTKIVILYLVISVGHTYKETDIKEEKQVDKRFASFKDGQTPLLSTFSLTPDIIFMIQRAGLTEKDFTFIKEFVGVFVGNLGTISPLDVHNRLGLHLFTDKVRHVIDFRSCCSGGRANLQYLIESASLPDYNYYTSQNHGDHSFLTPHRISIRTAFRVLKMKYLSNGQGKKKPKLVVFVTNFQSRYASFRLFIDAIDDIDAAKQAGAFLVLITVDPIENRQPRMRENDLWLSRDALGVDFDQHPASDIITLVNKRQASSDGLRLEAGGFRQPYKKQHQLHLASSLSTNQRAFLMEIKSLHENQTQDRMVYDHLALLYAQTLATRKDTGIVIRKYAELLYPTVVRIINQLLLKTTEWFGEGETTTTCPGTMDFLQRQIWTPFLFTRGNYFENTYCMWTITARKGYRINLRFNAISTEDVYDYITVFDGFEQDKYQLLGNFSGTYSTDDLPEVNSTEKKMLVTFRSDPGKNGYGFHATWYSVKMERKIHGAQILYLIDESASLSDNELVSIKSYVKRATKYFQYVDNNIAEELESIVTFNIHTGFSEEILESSKFGLLSFGDTVEIVSSIAESKTRRMFFKAVDSLRFSQRGTYIGRALDYSRINQFLLLENMNQSLPPVSEITNNSVENIKVVVDKPQPRRAIFLFSDALSIDDPKHAARRLCQSDIILVLIGVGRVSIEESDRLRSYCGLYFGIDTQTSIVIDHLKYQFGINMSRTSKLPPLPPLPSFPIRNSTTRIFFTTPKPVYVRRPPPVIQPLRPVCYWCIVIILVTIGIVEVLFWLGLLVTECTSPTFTRPSDSKELLEVLHNGKALQHPIADNSFFSFQATNRDELNNQELDIFETMKCCNRKANNKLTFH